MLVEYAIMVDTYGKEAGRVCGQRPALLLQKNTVLRAAERIGGRLDCIQNQLAFGIGQTDAEQQNLAAAVLFHISRRNVTFFVSRRK